MLDQGDGSDLIARLWQATELKAQLPDGEAQYFDLAGPLPMQFDNRRAYHRFFLRQRAVMKWNEHRLGVYVKDISRQGIGLLSPLQLFPLDKARLLLPDNKTFDAKVMRCRRLSVNCYEVGVEFADARALTSLSQQAPQAESTCEK